MKACVSVTIFLIICLINRNLIGDQNFTIQLKISLRLEIDDRLSNIKLVLNQTSTAHGVKISGNKMVILKFWDVSL